MFLAIINDTYSDIKSNSQPEDDGPLASFIKEKLKVVFHKRERHDSWESAELSNDEIQIPKILNEKGEANEPESLITCQSCKLNTEKLDR